jgi:hypothetical protein
VAQEQFRRVVEGRDELWVGRQIGEGSEFEAGEVRVESPWPVKNCVEKKSILDVVTHLIDEV